MVLSATSIARGMRTTTVGRWGPLRGAPGTGELPVGPVRLEATGLDLGLPLHLRGLLHRLEEALDRPACAADLVHLLGHRGAAVGQHAVTVLVHRAQRLVDLDELTVGQPA